MIYKKITKVIISSIIISIGILTYISCNKEEGGLDDIEIEEYVANCETIAIQADEIIQTAIQKAFSDNSDIDPNEIANKLTELDLVKSAEPSESGISIAIEHMDGS